MSLAGPVNRAGPVSWAGSVANYMMWASPELANFTTYKSENNSNNNNVSSYNYRGIPILEPSSSQTSRFLKPVFVSLGNTFL